MNRQRRPSATQGNVPAAWSRPLAEEHAFRQALDAAYLFDVADQLSQIGTCELGFRPSGTPAGHRAADFLLQQLQLLGLCNVRQEPFPVYAWEFSGASVELAGGEPLPASSYPPTPGTPAEGLASLLVDCGQGTAADYLGVDVRGRVAFVRFDTDRLPWMDTLAHEAELHGACALVFTYLNGYAQHESGTALNTHDGAARPTLPILQLARKDGLRLAERLEREGPLPATLRSTVVRDPAGTGLNVVGEIPGRLPERYLIVGAHYDAWFHGYWDNAIGVAGILSMAKALRDSGYEPEHTLLFIATDAEEFGAADTQFDWLIGCHRLLQAHPEWHRDVNAAFNIDTLAFQSQEQLGFIGPAELMAFLRAATGTYQARSFPHPAVRVWEQITAWTEVLAYAYVGIPPLQPRFALEQARRTVYHTQFDRADIVHRERAVETLQLYGSLLIRFDRQPILPYEFGERARGLRLTLGAANGAAPTETRRLQSTLDALEERAEELNRLLAGIDGDRLERMRAPLNRGLRQLAGDLIRQINYLSAADPDDTLPLHVYYERDLRALDAAIAHLEAGRAGPARDALTDRAAGVRGAWCAAAMSYPVYDRHFLNVANPGRHDLFWGQDRTAAISDLWAVLHSLQDKIDRGVAEFGPELERLRLLRKKVARMLLEALIGLTQVLEGAVSALEELSDSLEDRR